MSNTYITSDLHFGHDREFIWGARGYKCVEDMNFQQVMKFNSVVTNDDEVWLLGDSTLGDLKEGLYWLKQLNGKIHVVLGNHCTSTREAAYKELGWDVHVAARLKYKKVNFYLSHFPTITNNGKIESPFQVTWNLHGHTHATNQWNEYPYCYNVNVDAHDGYPVSLENIYQDILNHFGQQ